MPSIEIEFPLPPRELSPNGPKGKWRDKAKATRTYKEDCLSVAQIAFMDGKRQGITFPLPAAKGRPVRMHARFYLARTTLAVLTGRYIPLDADNARSSIKALQDSLVVSGILSGDSHETLKAGDTDLMRTKDVHEGRSCVVIRLEWQEPEPAPSPAYPALVGIPDRPGLAGLSSKKEKGARRVRGGKDAETGVPRISLVDTV